MIVYVPINNQQLPLNQEYESHIISGVLGEVDKYHGKEKGFKAEVLLYLSFPSMTMAAGLFASKYKWIEKAHISIDPDFDQDSLDTVAKRMTGTDNLKNVMCFRVVPRDMLDKKQMLALQNSLLKRFGEVYLLEIPEVVISDEVAFEE